MSTPCCIHPGREPAAGSILLMLILAGLLAVTVTACGQAFYTAEQHIDRAAEARAAGDLNTAIIELKNALQQDPSNVEARWQLGVLHLELADGVTAHSELTRALESGKDPDLVRVPLMQAAMLIGRHDEVISESRLIDSFPEDQAAVVMALRGQALLAKGERGAAQEILQAAHGIDPGHPEILYGLALSAAIAGNNDEAMTWLDDLVDRHADFVRAYELRGDIDRDNGDYKAAETAYTTGIEVAVHPASLLRLKRAMVRIHQSDFDAATADLDFLSRQFRRHPSIHYARGLIALNKGKFPEAQREFEQTLALDSSHMPAVFYVGVAHFVQEHWQQAETHLARFSSRNPHSVDASRLLAFARAQDADSDRAAETLRVALNRSPADIETMGTVASLRVARMGDEDALEPGDFARGTEWASIARQIRQGDFQRALNMTLEGLEANPGDPLLLMLKATAYLGLDDRPAARAAFEEALETLPGSPEASHNLAILAMQDGDIERARALYEEVLKHHPDHLQTLSQLMSLDVRAGDTEAALARVDQAISAHPEDVNPRMFKARYLLSNGRPFDAWAALTPVRDNNTDNARYLGVLGVSQLASGFFSDAADTFMTQLDLGPQAPEPRYLLAAASIELGNTNEATRLLQSLDNLDEDHPLRQLAQVRLLMLEREFEQAAARLRHLRDIYADNAEAQALSGELALRTGDAARAVGYYRSAMDLSSRSPWLIAMSAAQKRAGEPESAIGTLEQWLDRQPQDVAARLQLAQFHQEAGREDRARAAYRKALEHAPNNWIVMNNLAWLLRKENPDEALQLAGTAMQRAPVDVPEVPGTYGILLLEQGQHRQALDVLGQAIQRGADSRSIRFHYADALAKEGQVAEARRQLDRILADDQPFDERSDAEALRGRL